MKVVIFDVSNGSCSLVIDKNGNSLMIDCGGHGEKDCPVELISQWKSSSDGWIHPILTYTHNRVNYPLTRLQITHPDLDHIKNIQKVHTHFQPLILHRTCLSQYQTDEVENDSDGFSYYKDVDITYNLDISSDPSFPNVCWSFEFQKSYSISPSIIRENYELSVGGKLKNNSSIVTLIKEDGVSILFGGDMEEAGWKYLIDNNINGFADDIRSFGVDIFVAPHHGHHSGYSPELFEIIAPSITLISKGVEEGDESDVSPYYSQNSSGELFIQTLNGNTIGTRSSLTTRKDGNIFVATTTNSISIFTSKGYPEGVL